MCTSKEDEHRERGERTKDVKKLSSNVYNEEHEEEKNVAPHVVSLSCCYRIRENEDVKKMFFSFSALSIRAHHHRMHTHMYMDYKSCKAFSNSNLTTN